MRIISRTHYFMKFFTRSYSDNLMSSIRRKGFCKICNFNRWYFGDKYLPAIHSIKIFKNKFHSLSEGDPESSHFRMSYRKAFSTIFYNFFEKWHDWSSRANNIAISNHWKSWFSAACHVVSCNKQLIRSQLCCSI